MNERIEWLAGDSGPGKLEALVHEEHKRQPERAYSNETLKIIFCASEAPWVAAAIDEIESREVYGRGDTLPLFGNNYIEPYDGAVSPEDIDLEDPEELSGFLELTVGCDECGMSTLTWLDCLARHIQKVPPSILELLNGLCKTLFEVLQDMEGTRTN